MLSLNGFLHGITGSYFMVTWTIFINHLLEVSLTRNRKTTAFWTLTTVDSFYIIMCEDPMNRNSLKQHSIEDLVTYDFTLQLKAGDRTTWFWQCLGTDFGHFLLGSYNFTVTALGSCVKWPSPKYLNFKHTHSIRIIYRYVSEVMVWSNGINSVLSFFCTCCAYLHIEGSSFMECRCTRWVGN